MTLTVSALEIFSLFQVRRNLEKITSSVVKRFELGDRPATTARRTSKTRPRGNALDRVRDRKNFQFDTVFEVSLSILSKRNFIQPASQYSSHVFLGKFASSAIFDNNTSEC